MKKVLVLVGPTGSGKSELGIFLAKRFAGEIISGDSIQVYRGLNIGSAKVTPAQQAEVPHHLIDILSPLEKYNVAIFQQKARAAIADITERGKLPILVGGTGLYIRACLYDYIFAKEEEADNLYPELSNQQLWDLLKEVDPLALEKIHPHNRKRLLRAYNVFQKSGKPFSQQIAEQEHRLLYDAKIIGLHLDREELYRRIERRVQHMAAQGLREEIAKLLHAGVHFSDLAMQGIGYREYQEYFAGKKTEEECLADICRDTRHYAKRQYTFFRNQFPVEWFNPCQRKLIENEVEKWQKN